jgi:hypothetical protein
MRPARSSQFAAIEDSLSMEPAVSNYPAFLIQGSVEFRLHTTELSEASRGVNFNPPGSPYEGSTNKKLNDTYPSQIKGLVYVSGTADITLDDTVVDAGLLVVGNEITVSVGETLTVNYAPHYFSNPPPGFSRIQVRAVPGSWLWDAAP